MLTRPHNTYARGGSALAAALSVVAALLAAFSAPCHAAAAAADVASVQRDGDTVVVRTPNYQIRVTSAGFRFALERPDGTVIAPAHAVSGLRFGGHDAATAVAPRRRRRDPRDVRRHQHRGSEGRRRDRPRRTSRQVLRARRRRRPLHGPPHRRRVPRLRHGRPGRPRARHDRTDRLRPRQPPCDGRRQPQESGRRRTPHQQLRHLPEARAGRDQLRPRREGRPPHRIRERPGHARRHGDARDVLLLRRPRDDLPRVP